MSLGGGRQFAYPKWVWSPSGGWWANPVNRNRNLAIYLVGVVFPLTSLAWTYSDANTGFPLLCLLLLLPLLSALYLFISFFLSLFSFKFILWSFTSRFLIVHFPHFIRNPPPDVFLKNSFLGLLHRTNTVSFIFSPCNANLSGSNLSSVPVVTFFR